MSTTSQELLKSFDQLPPAEKREVASKIIRRTFAFDRAQLDEIQLTAVYAEFADDDGRLAEEGIEDGGTLVGEDEIQ